MKGDLTGCAPDGLVMELDAVIEPIDLNVLAQDFSGADIQNGSTNWTFEIPPVAAANDDFVQEQDGIVRRAVMEDDTVAKLKYGEGSGFTVSGPASAPILEVAYELRRDVGGE